MNSGTIDGSTHTLKERVYYEHTDFSGVVYHARYLDFLEHGRSDYVRMLGVHHNQMADGIYGEKLAFAVHHMEINFVGAAKIDDTLDIQTDKGKLQGARITFAQRIKRDDELLIDAKVTVVLTNSEGKVRRYPKEILEKLGVGK